MNTEQRIEAREARERAEQAPSHAEAGQGWRPSADVVRTAMEVVCVADDEARQYGSLRYGLIDAVDNHGELYQSAALASALKILRAATDRPLPSPPTSQDGERDGSSLNPSPDTLTPLEGELVAVLERVQGALTMALMSPAGSRVTMHLSRAKQHHAAIEAALAKARVQSPEVE